MSNQHVIVFEIMNTRWYEITKILKKKDKNVTYEKGKLTVDCNGYL